MAAITDQLGAPITAREVDGKYTLWRFHRLAASVLAPIVPINIYSIVNVTAEAPAPQSEREVFQQGGGDESLTVRRVWRYGGVIQMKAGEVGNFYAAILGKTWSTAGEAAIPMRMPEVPVACVEGVCRREDNVTHLFSKVYQDIILRETNFGSPMEDEIVDIPFISRHDPFIICTGAEMVLDKFAGTGSTTDFTLSSTPLTAVETDDDAREDWALDNAPYVKQWIGATATEGTRQKSGISLTGTTLAFTTAPGAADTVEVLYIAATA